MENKYKEGQVVHANENPGLKLVIRRYVDRIYYCKVQEDLTRKELAYFERQLSADAAPADDAIAEKGGNSIKP